MGACRSDHGLRPLTVFIFVPQPSNQNTMFRRIIYEDWQLIFPVIALIVASVIYVAVAWRAAHMKPEQVERLARLPLDN